MAIGFIIMQIGNPALDQVCGDAIAPAIEATGLKAKRVDKHNQGGLLKSEIIQFIESAEIIVADLTNERPNCYLEIGFAMGVDKFKNLILTARSDHQPDLPGRKPGDPKVHFDLGGYDVLYWNPSDIPAFRSELEKRIRRRLAVIAAPQSLSPRAFVWDDAWFKAHRSHAIEGIRKTKAAGHVEIAASLYPPQAEKSQTVLLAAAKESQIDTFGWPIGVVMDGTKDRPRPTPDGILTEISEGRYDYWSLRKNGDFYLLMSLFEDSRDVTKLFFNTRIIRATEALLYLMRLYTRMGVDPATTLHFQLRHSGLKGRELTAVGNRWMHRGRTTTVDVVDAEIATTLSDLQARLPQHVKALLDPLFVVFDFFEVGQKAYEDIVNNFIAGRCT